MTSSNGIDHLAPSDRAIGPADFEAIYRHNLDGVLVTLADGRILAANPAACAILGLGEREIVDRGREGLMDVADPRLASALAERAAIGHARAELRMRRGDGVLFPADVSSTIFVTPDGEQRAAVIFRDITDVVARARSLEEAAEHDPLTGLLNRRGFGVAASQALAAADRQDTVAQLVFVDIDNMKRINDEHGHAAGDAAIVAVAAAIARATRESDVICRFGGDEFVALLLDSPASEIPAIVDRIDRELDVDPDRTGEVTCSIGVIQRRPHDPTELTELIDAADREMYRHKIVHRLRLTS